MVDNFKLVVGDGEAGGMSLQPAYYLCFLLTKGESKVFTDFTETFCEDLQIVN